MHVRGQIGSGRVDPTRPSHASYALQTAPSLVNVGIFNEFRFVPIPLPVHQLTRIEIDCPFNKQMRILKQAPDLIEARSTLILTNNLGQVCSTPLICCTSDACASQIREKWPGPESKGVPKRRASTIRPGGMGTDHPKALICAFCDDSRVDIPTTWIGAIETTTSGLRTHTTSATPKHKSDI
jgi:hypothetical protein